MISPIPANPIAATTTITQPTCSVNTGSFTITAPLGASLEYSIDGGVTYQTGLTFTSLAAGASYSLTVHNTTTGCVSTASVVAISPALNIPLAATATTTVQPTCSIPTGTIVVTSPIGATLQYSKDGIVFQSSTTFSGLAANTIYSITVKNTASGCVSTTATLVTVNAIPSNPTTPTATTTVQPTCSLPTGTIVVTAPLGATLEYSKDGIGYQSSTTFTTLAANASYTITVRDSSTGCVSTGTVVAVNAIPTNPTAPAGTMVQPTCTSPTGSITISSPVGVIFEYSKDAGVSYQSSTIFTGLAANATYTIQVRNTTTGCFSSGTGFVISPATVFAPTPTVFGNNICEGETINLSTPTVLGATYSWTGPNGFSSTDQNPIILNATSEMSGTYNLISTLVIGCPSLPGQVSVTVNNLPTPELEQNGYVCVDSLTNAVLQSFNLDSGLTNAGYTFEWFEIIGNVPNPILGEIQSTIEISTAGVFGVIATNKITGCKSELVSANVGVSSPPVTMDIVTSQYFDNTDSITITVLPIGNYEYKIDDGAYQNSNLFNSVSEGNHTIEVRDINGCGSIYKSTSIVDFPKFFTPNGDGYNDSWNISSLSGKGISKIYIFDRYGKFIKEISPLDNGWDGTINQVNLPASDYWFSVYYEENNISKVFKSHFALKR